MNAKRFTMNPINMILKISTPAPVYDPSLPLKEVNELENWLAQGLADVGSCFAYVSGLFATLLLSVVSATGEGVAGACFESSFIPGYSHCYGDWSSDGLMEQGRLSS